MLANVRVFRNESDFQEGVWCSFENIEDGKVLFHQHEMIDQKRGQIEVKPGYHLTIRVTPKVIEASEDSFRITESPDIIPGPQATYQTSASDATVATEASFGTTKIHDFIPGPQATYCNTEASTDATDATEAVEATEASFRITEKPDFVPGPQATYYKSY